MYKLPVCSCLFVDAKSHCDSVAPELQGDPVTFQTDDATLMTLLEFTFVVLQTGVGGWG